MVELSIATGLPLTELETYDARTLQTFVDVLEKQNRPQNGAVK
jgi:hypothetical protein